MGVHDISELPKVLDRYATSIEKAFYEAGRIIAETGFKYLVEGTPVDTNRALSNWQVNVGSPITTYVPTRSPGATGGKGAGFVQARVLAEGNAKISQWRPDKNPKLFIANNAPYIMKLERGWSAKQPGAFVATGLQAMRLRATQVRIIKQEV